MAEIRGLGYLRVQSWDLPRWRELTVEALGFLPRGAVPTAGSAPNRKPLRARFLDVNQRHHSLAICPVPRGEPPSLAHLTVEVGSLDARAAHQRATGATTGPRRSTWPPSPRRNDSAV